MSDFDTASVHEFLTHTPEKGLRNMLIDNKKFTNAHFTLLLKIAKAGPAEQFSQNFSSVNFPKIKFTKDEEKIRETFWKDCTAILVERGLMQKAKAA